LSPWPLLLLVRAPLLLLMRRPCRSGSAQAVHRPDSAFCCCRDAIICSFARRPAAAAARCCASYGPLCRRAISVPPGARTALPSLLPSCLSLARTTNLWHDEERHAGPDVVVSVECCRAVRGSGLKTERPFPSLSLRPSLVCNFRKPCRRECDRTVATKPRPDETERGNASGPSGLPLLKPLRRVRQM
jgi:hypothetical protein